MKIRIIYLPIFLASLLSFFIASGGNTRAAEKKDVSMQEMSQRLGKLTIASEQSHWEAGGLPLQYEYLLF